VLQIFEEYKKNVKKYIAVVCNMDIIFEALDDYQLDEKWFECCLNLVKGKDDFTKGYEIENEHKPKIPVSYILDKGFPGFNIGSHVMRELCMYSNTFALLINFF